MVINICCFRGDILIQIMYVEKKKNVCQKLEVNVFTKLQHLLKLQQSSPTEQFFSKVIVTFYSVILMSSSSWLSSSMSININIAILFNFE